MAMCSPRPLRFLLLGLLVGVLFHLALAPGLAQRPTPGASPIDADAVLATLKDLKARQVVLIGREKQGVMAAISGALADPAKAYEQAVVAVDFQGGGNDGSKIADWRRKQGDLLRNPAFVTGLRLQLTYIALTWQRSMGAKNKDILNPLLDYAAQLTANYDAMYAFESFRKPLKDQVFVRYFQIGPYIASLDNWSEQPFEPDTVYDKAILPTLRELKDPRILDYWSGKVQMEAAKVERSGNNLAVNKFNSVRRPELLWNRAEDEEAIGLHEQAVADMLALAKAHPDHPDFDKWAARLTALVRPVKAEVIVHDVPDAAPVH